MDWYKNMTKQQREDFWKVITVSVTGAIIVLLVPTIFHIV
jgi:protein tyrosine phosphatase